MRLTELLHQKLARGRRVRVLAGAIADMLPGGAAALDVGSGDGEIASQILRLRPDVSIIGIDVLARESTAVPIEIFDGKTIPYDDESFDVVMLIDVLHHSDQQEVLLSEAKRVARASLVIKDHLLQGAMSRRTLRFMDSIGNDRHGVRVPFNYLTPTEWNAAYDRVGLHVDCQREKLGLYSWPAGLLFDRKLHFIARLNI